LKSFLPVELSVVVEEPRMMEGVVEGGVTLKVEEAEPLEQ
jgi:hypothetical protein